MSFESPLMSSEKFIPVWAPALNGNEWAYVKDCLDTRWVSSVGSYVDRFELVMVEYLGAGFAVATVSGTAALHVALLLAGVEAEEEVLVPAFTFIATANAVRYCNARPVFLDVSPETGNLDPERVREFLEEECRLSGGVTVRRRSGRRVRAVLPVHLYGHPANMPVLSELAQAYGLKVVEDGAESLGAALRGERLGAQSDLICFSFNGNKIITTGGGGMIVTQHRHLADRARHLMTQAKADPTQYLHDMVGFNYRMPNINAALGLAQLEQIDKLLQCKRRIAHLYQQELAGVPSLRVAGEADGVTSSYWLVNVFLEESRTMATPADLAYRLGAAGIATRPLWYPLHLQPAYRDSESYRVRVAEQLWATGLTLPSSPTLSDGDVQRVCGFVREAVMTDRATTEGSVAGLAKEDHHE